MGSISINPLIWTKVISFHDFWLSKISWAKKGKRLGAFFCIYKKGRYFRDNNVEWERETGLRGGGGGWRRRKVRDGKGRGNEGGGSNLPEFWSRRTYTPKFTESIADIKWGNHPPPLHFIVVTHSNSTEKKTHFSLVFFLYFSINQ